MRERGNRQSEADRSPVFQTTHWSVVLEAASGDSTAALERLCRTYWYPLYGFARRQGHSPQDAEDLTQGFFELLLTKQYLKDVVREKGRFRSFLLASFKHYLANQWKRGTRQKRGGRIPAISFDAMCAEQRYRHEPAAGKSSSLTVATDIYSLGVILYEMLTGRAPFAAETATRATSSRRAWPTADFAW